jgi:hypothetical protein
MSAADELTALCENGAFNHRAAVLELLRTGGATIPDPPSTGGTADGMLEIYGTRQKHLERLAREYGEGLDPALRVVLDDVRALVLWLERAGDAPIRCWDLSLAGGACYMLVEALDEQRVVACVKAQDQRILPYRNQQP